MCMPVFGRTRGEQAAVLIQCTLCCSEPYGRIEYNSQLHDTRRDSPFRTKMTDMTGVMFELQQKLIHSQEQLLRAIAVLNAHGLTLDSVPGQSHSGGLNSRLDTPASPSVRPFVSSGRVGTFSPAVSSVLGMVLMGLLLIIRVSLSWNCKRILEMLLLQSRRVNGRHPRLLKGLETRKYCVQMTRQ